MYRYSFRWIFSLCLALLATTPALAASTARESIKEVTTAAQKWQPDAVLTHISTLRGHADGRADSWRSIRRGKKSAIVTARDKKIEVDLTCVLPPPIRWVQSSSIWQGGRSAVKATEIRQGDRPGMGLVVGNRPPANRPSTGP
jgi:hypothetical protein